MKHVLWIGGPPATGKTTIASRLARRYGVRLYSADTRTWVHRDRALTEGSTAAQRWESLTPADRWERSTPAEMLEMSLHRERGRMVIDDLRAFPPSPLTIAEGSTLPASAVSSGIAERSRAVWLLPTVEFQDRMLARTGISGGHAVLGRLLRGVIEHEALEHDVLALTVDGSQDVAEMVEAVDRLFGDVFAAGPRATTLAERRHLVRESNDAVVAQVRGYYARPWANGDPDVVTRSFACECGNATCDVDLDLTVGDASTRRALAPGHLADA